MAGITPHGIRYPDGASKAKNLGPELEQMANDIDYYIGSYLRPDGPIRQIVIDIAEAIVPGMVEDYLEDANAVRAYPKENLPYTSLSAIPLQWVTQNFRTPYRETYSSDYRGHWVNGVTRQGRAVIEDQAGKIAESQIPDTIARKSDIPTDPAPGPIDVNVSRHISPLLPIFAARVRAARTAGTPVSVVTTGSSTTMRTNPGYVDTLRQYIQEVWPLVDQPAMQSSREAIFTSPSSPGIHFLNAGDGGTGVGNYLTDEECDRIAALNPAMVTHMIGANNYTGQTDPTHVETTLRARLAYLDAVIPGPCQHVLIQQYAKVDFIPPTYPIDVYRDIMSDLAAEADNRVFVDLSKPFELVGVYAGGPDPLDLISPDGTHANPAGYYYIADALAAHFTV